MAVTKSLFLKGFRKFLANQPLPAMLTRCTAIRINAYNAASILTREGVMPNQKQSGSNPGGGQRQSGQNQVNPQQHTQHNDRKSQPGSQQGGSGQQSGSNDRDRMKDKSGQS